MKSFPFFRTLFVALFAATAAMPAMSASAAIPCQELPVIEADPMMPVPMIYIELPVSVEGALTRGGEADRTNATEVEDGSAAGVIMAAENQFLCLGYGQDIVFVGNSTPQQRVNMFARPNIEAEVEKYIEVQGIYVVQIGTPLALEDGRFLVDYAIMVDGTQFLAGEMVFVNEDAGYYLDGSTVVDRADLNPESIDVELSTVFTREVKIIEAANGDKVVFENTEDKTSATIVITNADGEPVFEGFAPALQLVGGTPSNVFIVHNLEPGEYQVTVVFDQDDVTFGATIVVSEDAGATPEASPES